MITLVDTGKSKANSLSQSNFHMIKLIEESEADVLILLLQLAYFIFSNQ